MQERVPARRRHGLAQDRGAGRASRAARRPAPLPHVRLGPGAEPDGLRRRPAGESAGRRRAGPAAGRALAGGGRGPAAAPVPAGQPGPVACPPAGGRRRPGGSGVPRRFLHQLHRARRGAIVGVEPSCLLTLRDDYPALLPGDPRAQAVAAASTLPEELLLEAIADGRLTLSPIAGKRILFHGHCHQKAVTGTAATVALLRAIPGAEVTEVDAGCCGMAGSFGFEAEHYDLSLRIGELRLFPAVRAEPAGTIIAASGVSCRQQIAHGTGRAARHPLEIVRSALVPPA